MNKISKIFLILSLLCLLLVSSVVIYYFLESKNRININKEISEVSSSVKILEKATPTITTTPTTITIPKDNQKVLVATTTTKVIFKKTTVISAKNIIPIKEEKIVKEDEVVRAVSPVVSLCTEASGSFAGQIETEINNVRVSYGLSKLIACKELRSSSYKKYLDIVAQNNFTHDWTGGKSLYDVIVSSGYVPQKWGEILEYGSDFTTAREHVDNWMGSPTHKAIILGKDYTHFGVYVGAWTVEDIGVDMGIAHFGKK